MGTNNQIIIYQTDDDQTQIDVRLENETVWLTQAQMAELFQTDRTSIVRHINKIYADDELDRDSTCAKIAQVQKEGRRPSNIRNKKATRLPFLFSYLLHSTPIFKSQDSTTHTPH